MNWKGNKVSYDGLHRWLINHFPKPKICDFCKLKKPLDWALKKGKSYSRNIKDYFALCRKCHTNYDWTKEKTKNISLGHKGQTPWNKGLKGVQKPYWLGKKRLDMLGSKHWNWKGGKSLSLNSQI